jgi:rubredoxin
MIKCSFCGYEYSESQSSAGCSGCPMRGACGKQRCPNCGFESPREPGIIKLIKKAFGKQGHGA